MMNPLAAVESVIFKAFNFSGRAPRSEYWWWALVQTTILTGLIILDFAPLFTESEPEISQLGYTSGIFVLLTGIPNFAVTIRRLHDTGRSGFWFFITLVPFIGGLWFLILLCLPSQRDDNIWGAPYRKAGSWAGKAQGRPDPMQGYAVLDRLKESPSDEMMQARKQEIHDYYKARVLKASA